MSNKKLPYGFRGSESKPNTIINSSSTKSVTFTSYGAIDNNGAKIYTNSPGKLNDWVEKRSGYPKNR